MQGGINNNNNNDTNSCTKCGRQFKTPCGKQQHTQKFHQQQANDTGQPPTQPSNPPSSCSLNNQTRFLINPKKTLPQESFYCGEIKGSDAIK